ncbi:MAG: oligosaccharide flippase family protein [Thiomargarita sp.]|nr:oligosaccharide flippase family protein [Thiomargarita sp.]
MKRFLRNNFLILILMNLGNVFAYLFQMVIGRVLSPDDFGAFNALNSLAIVISAPMAVLPLVFSRYTVQLSADGLGRVKTLLIDSFRILSLLAVIIFILGIIALPWFKDFLHLQESTPIIIMLTQLLLSLFVPVLLGTLQGLQRFVFFGIGSSGTAFLRLVGAILFVYALGWGINGGLLATVFATFGAMLICIMGLKDIWQQERQLLPVGLYREMGKYALPVLIFTSMMMVLGNLDIVLVRHYCSAEEAGLYATAAILGRIALFLPGVLLIVLFPEAAKAKHENNEDQRILWLSMAMTALLGGGFALVCYLWPVELTVLLFGTKYQAAAPLLQTISFAMALLAVANVIFVYSLAHHKFIFLFPLVLGVITMLSLVFVYHDSAMTIANILLGAIMGILIVTLGLKTVKML